MNEKIKKAFDQIQAEDELKNKTKDFILVWMSIHQLN